MKQLKSMSFDEVSAAYPDDAAAHDYFVKARWPDGPYCSHCGSFDVYDAKSSRKRPIWKCRDCKQQFSVTTGTVMESSKLGLRKWLLAFYLLSAHKKSVSAHQLSRDFGITLKTAWFLAHRIREAMREKPDEPLFGMVEADLTWVGGSRKRYGRGYVKNKLPVHGMASRNRGRRGKGKGKGGGGGHSRFQPGQVRLIAHRKGTDPNKKLLGEQITDNVIPDESILNTDETNLYDDVGRRFLAHEKVNHGEDEYVRGDAHTNTIEGAFANVKRQINGTRHSISEQHSQRYLDEHSFRYNHREETDAQKFVRAVRGAGGKRLRLFKAKRGKAPSLWKRRVHEPATDESKSVKGARGLSRRAKRAGRKAAREKRAADMRAALALIAKQQAGEDDGEE